MNQLRIKATTRCMDGDMPQVLVSCAPAPLAGKCTQCVHESVFLPLPPGEAATQWRVRERDISDFVFPSSPALFLYLQSCRYGNPGEYIPVFPLDGPKLRFDYCSHLAPEGEGSAFQSASSRQKYEATGCKPVAIHFIRHDADNVYTA